MLEEAGFSRNQAETSIKILIDVMDDKFATKQDIARDIAELRSATQQDIAELRSETQKDIAEVKNAISALSMSMKTEILQLKHDLILKMGAMISAAVAIAATLHKFL